MAEIRECVAAMSNAFENRKISVESRGHDERENDESASDDGNENQQGFGTHEQDSETAAPERPKRKIIPTKKADRRICDYCTENFVGKAKSQFENHVKRCKRFHQFVEGENSNRCGLCSREFANNWSLFAHLEKTHGNQLSSPKAKTPGKKTCENCELEVVSHGYNVHVKSCQRYKGLIKRNECLVCKKSFGSRAALLGHMGYKHFKNRNVATAKPEEKPSQNSSILGNLECPNCQALFKNEELLLEHVEICSTVVQDDDEDPSLSLPVKECTFCGDLVPQAVLRKHLLRCAKAADLIKGMKCNRCPQLQFKYKREVYAHVLKSHIPNENDDETADETISQFDLDENVTSMVEKTSRNESGAGGPIITEVDGTPRDLDENMTSIVEKTTRNDSGAGGPIISEVVGIQRQPIFRGETAMVRRDYYVDVDPNVITCVFMCPLCKSKLARKDHAERHVTMFHKIDLTLFRSLNLAFSVIPV